MSPSECVLILGYMRMTVAAGGEKYEALTMAIRSVEGRVVSENNAIAEAEERLATSTKNLRDAVEALTDEAFADKYISSPKGVA